jgi:adenylate cyclase
MAVFDGTDGVRQSCLCAIRIIENAKADTESFGLSQLGIGIHYGRAVIGNIGSHEHLDYSVIGTTVNIAARLCGHAEPMSIVVSKAVRDSVSTDHRLSFPSERQVIIRGLKRPVTIYGLSSAFSTLPQAVGY